MMTPVFQPVASYLPEGSSGNVRIEHFEISKKESEATKLRAFMRDADAYVPPGRYTRLLVNGQIMMSDTPMEERTNRRVIARAQGHVFIAGLGLGMIVYPIASKPEVTSITIVEKSPDVVRLVSPHLPPKVRVIEADVFDWKPEKGTRFDCLWFDVWAELKGENLEEMARLHRKFAHYKTKEAWMDSWSRDKLLRAQEQWRRSYVGRSERVRQA